MSKSALVLAATTLLVLGACSKTDTAQNDHGARVSIDIDSDDKPGSKVTVNADSDTGKMEIKLPGGLQARMNLPNGMDGLGTGDSKFDIDGVGLFPGARVSSVNVNASDARETRSAVVKIGFNAPGDAAAVADWYQQQFEAKHRVVARSGEILTGSTEDDNPFTLAIETAGAGASKGLLTITDSRRG